MIQVKRVVISIVTILILFAAISSLSSKSDVNQNDGFTYIEIKQGMRFTVEMDRNYFTANDEIKVKVEVTNTLHQPVPYYVGSSTPGCETYLDIRIMWPKQRKAFMPKYTKDMACTDDIVESELKPGESLRMETVSVPKVSLDTETLIVPSGEYDVKILFNRIDNGPVEISFPIVVSSDGTDIISSEDAEETVLQAPQVSQWISLHTGNSISREEDGQFFILFYDGWKKVPEDEYNRLRYGIFTEERSIHYEHGNWKIVYVSKLGIAPHRIEIKVDAASGKITSIETHEK